MCLADQTGFSRRLLRCRLSDLEDCTRDKVAAVMRVPEELRNPEVPR